MEQLIGNEGAQAQFKQYLTYNQTKEKPLFLILIGPEGIGKTSFLRFLAEEILGEHLQTDFFWMRDLSKELGKAHPIQIETPTALKTIPLDDTTSYENRGVREINAWLQQSAISNKKILLIENLQRMTNSAMNAFLKTCEEPLANRYLFATAEHESGLLPTILSRAMLIRFVPLKDSEMASYLREHLHFFGTELEQQLLVKMSLGKPGTLHLLLEIKEKNPEAFGAVLELSQLMREQGQWHKKQQIFKKIDEVGLLDTFITSLIKEQAETGMESRAEEWIKTKQLISANITQENALRYGLLASES